MFFPPAGVFSATCVWVCCMGIIEGMHQRSMQLSKRLQQSADAVNSNWQSMQCNLAYYCVQHTCIPFCCICQHPVVHPAFPDRDVQGKTSAGQTGISIATAAGPPSLDELRAGPRDGRDRQDGDSRSRSANRPTRIPTYGTVWYRPRLM